MSKTRLFSVHSPSKHERSALQPPTVCAPGKNLAHSLRYNADQIIKMHEKHEEPESNLVKKYKAIQKKMQEKLRKDHMHEKPKANWIKRLLGGN